MKVLLASSRRGDLGNSTRVVSAITTLNLLHTIRIDLDRMTEGLEQTSSVKIEFSIFLFFTLSFLPIAGPHEYGHCKRASFPVASLIRIDTSSGLATLDPSPWTSTWGCHLGSFGVIVRYQVEISSLCLGMVKPGICNFLAVIPRIRREVYQPDSISLI